MIRVMPLIWTYSFMSMHAPGAAEAYRNLEQCPAVCPPEQLYKRLNFRVGDDPCPLSHRGPWSQVKVQQGEGVLTLLGIIP